MTSRKAGMTHLLRRARARLLLDGVHFGGLHHRAVESQVTFCSVACKLSVQKGWGVLKGRAAAIRVAQPRPVLHQLAWKLWSGLSAMACC